MPPTPTTSQKLQIRRWDKALVKLGSQLPILRETMVDLPAEHDPAREVAKARAVALTNAKRARGCRALVGGGFVVYVEK
jgi:hypothetical protein